MKKLFLLSLFLLSLATCKERDADPNVLPPATQTGANTAGCLVDGKIWVASKKYINPLGGAGTFGEIFNNKLSFRIDLRNVTTRSSIYIKTNIENFELNKEYILPQGAHPNFDITNYSSKEDRYYQIKSPNYTGKLKITRVDIPKNIISGTFEFKAVDKDGNVVNVTDGRFDKKFD